MTSTSLKPFSKDGAASIPLDLAGLRSAIQAEYAQVAENPEKGFHFHTGRRLARLLGYRDEWVDALPPVAAESFAGTGNPFSLGELRPGERVVDVGCGAGFDSLIAGRMVGPTGQVVGVDMTPAMVQKARRNAAEAGLSNVDFREGYAESLPVPEGWADVVISNGVINLVPDKVTALAEMARVLRAADPISGRSGGRLQIGDILVQKPVPESAKANVDLWTG